MNTNLEDQREVEETEERNDIFLYNNETSNEGESCNVLCLFLFFISLFFIMVITADNSPPSNDYDSRNNGDTDILNDSGNEKIMNDILDNILIQSLNFKGYYKIKDTTSNNYLSNKLNDDLNVKKGKFEAKLITLKLALTNASKSYIFFHFEPFKNELKKKKNNKKNKKYQFIGLSGININKSNNYIFNGIGYNIANFCQNFNENCLCNYRINIKQYLSNYESTSLRELDESYLYSLKNYLLDETEYYKNFVSHQYYKQYEEYINNIDNYYSKNFTKSNPNNNNASVEEKNTREIYNEYEKLNEDTYLEKKSLDDNLKNSSTKDMMMQLEDETLNNPKTSNNKMDINEKKEFTNMTNGNSLNEKKDNYESYSESNNKNISTNNENEALNKEENRNFFNINTEDKIENYNDYEGYILSNNCNLFISINGDDIDKSYISNKVMNFSIIFNIKSIIELGLFWSQIGNSENMRNAAKISLISICLNSFIEIFESLLLLYEVMLSRLLLIHFIIMVLLKFLLFTLMEVRYVLIIWKANHQQDINDGWEYMQRKLSKLYKYYYGSILILIILFYYVFPLFPYILLVLYLCWLPQILLDIWKGQRNSINLKFVFFLSLCRLFLPIYIFIYPYNIFQLDIFTQVIDTSNATFSILLIIIIAIQLICMLTQRIYGPRYFVNIDILPHVHNYYKTIDPNFESGIPECVICMYDILLKDKKYCVTPCYHIFHEKCLQQWMNIKLECPTCRGSLPNFP
ncbi:RING zinc finger protein, putative [Plasmodium gallinaceum]|uniref:RING-type E3 ubiquitin transferase n=1 Tax=Plasmodium gallinaceum TaxID=5849 RepID=A0A1J1GS76_PLAGA|nr:RING zinc finger protein, putative [Plasmodium gallinaceum]CRG95347.1 RING zinc finger protein, putative [Plasmodium gallinaceum]